MYDSVIAIMVKYYYPSPVQAKQKSFRALLKTNLQYHCYVIKVLRL